MYGRYKGSARRLRRIRWNDGWPPEMWFLIAGLVVVGVLILTGVIRHPDHYGVLDRPR